MKPMTNNLCAATALGLTLAFVSCSDSSDGGNAIIIPGAPAVEVKIGSQMPLWQNGTFEIHSISTGRGESNFYIFPDGTSMLIDAAGSLVTEEICTKKGVGTVTQARPGWHISSADIIANYIKHFNPRGENVDYYLNSHTHEDHMGSWPEKYEEYADFPKHTEGNFYMNGIVKLGTLLNFTKIIDRGYTLPINMGTDDRIKDYQRFLKWSMDTKGLIYEVAKPGHDDQIVMRYNPSAYPDFKIRILCASGYAWTGNGYDTRRTIPTSKTEISKASPDENIFSVALMMDFGKFNLFTAGDLQWEATSSAPWLNADEGIIPVVNKVEVMKASHHGSTNANSEELVNKLCPQTVWINPWRSEQPGIPCMRRFVAANSDVSFFTTGIVESSKAPLAEVENNFKSWSGHIVMRVFPDGKYYVYVLDDNDESYTVKSIHGPYISE